MRHISARPTHGPPSHMQQQASSRSRPLSQAAGQQGSGPSGPVPGLAAAPAASATAAAPALTRRGVLSLLAPLGWLSAAALAGRPAAAAAAALDLDKGGTVDPQFYSQWPYVRPADILPYLRATATAGDPASVLVAIDTFALAYPMYRWVGDEVLRGGG